MKKISETLSFVKKHGLFPNTPVVESPHAPEVVVDGKTVPIPSLLGMNP